MRQQPSYLHVFFWVFTEKVAILGVQMLSMVILARYISPSEFAIIGVASFFTAIAAIFYDSGMGGALIKKQDVTDADYSTLFIYNVSVALLFCGILYVAAEGVASYYEIPELKSVLRAINAVILINSLGAVQQLHLIKELQFKKLMAISLIASFLSVIVAVYMAMNNYGVWSIIAQQIIQSTISIILLFGLVRFIPKLKFSVKSFKEQFSFGMYLMVSNILNTLSSNMYNLLFPKVTTLKFSGYYAQTNKIYGVASSLIQSTIDRAVFPILSSIKNADEFKRSVVMLLQRISFLSFTLFFSISLVSEAIVTILLGEAWSESYKILEIISLAGVGNLVVIISRNILKSVGKTNGILILQVACSTVSIAVLLLTFIFNEYIILYGIVLSSLITAIIAIYLVSRVIDLTVKKQLKKYSENLIIILVPYIVIMLLQYYFIEIPYYYSPLTLVGFLISIIIMGKIFNSTEVEFYYKFIKNKLCRKS